MSPVDSDGSIYAGKYFIGTLEGFQIKEDANLFDGDNGLVRADIDRIVAQEVQNRADELDGAGDGEISLILGEPMIRSTLNWRGIAIARIIRGKAILTPKAVVMATPLLQGDVLKQVQIRVDRWLENYIGEILSPLFALQEAVNGPIGADGNDVIDGIARGIAFQMVEKLGTIPRRMIARDFRSVTPEGRFQMKRLGIWLGAASLYIPVLLKPAPARLRLLLWALFNDREQLPGGPGAGLCTIVADQKTPQEFYEVSGYRVVGRTAVRLDMLERLANAAREISLKGPFPASPDLMSLVGTSGEDFIEIMKYLGYVYQEYSPEEAGRIAAVRAAAIGDKTEQPHAEEQPSENPCTEPNAAPEPQVEIPVVPEKIFLFRHQPYQKPERKKADKPARSRKPVPAEKPKALGKPGKRTQHIKPVHKNPVGDPHSPFAALAGLKKRLKSRK